MSSTLKHTAGPDLAGAYDCEPKVRLMHEAQQRLPKNTAAVVLAVLSLFIPIKKDHATQSIGKLQEEYCRAHRSALGFSTS